MAELLSLNEQYIIVPAFVGSYGTFECQVQVFTYRSICETQRGLMESPPQLVFGPFRLDPSQICLWRGEQAIPLRPRAHAVALFGHASRPTRHTGTPAAGVYPGATWPQLVHGIGT
jgi:hypothetical protein